MRVVALKTKKIVAGDDLNDILSKHIKTLEEGSIVAITSKIVSICEGRIIPIDKADKDELIKKEADFYLPKNKSKYNLFLTIKNNLFSVSAGIDESNTNGYYVLWPEDSQKTANEVRKYLTKKFNLKNFGVIITDSKTSPLRTGVTGAAIGYSGFKPLNDLIGTPDIFGRELKMTKIAVLDALAGASVFEMGEGNNQTPLAVITDVPYVEFVDRNPNDEELSGLKMPIEDDVYAALLTSVEWQKGGK